jgi:phosphomannomutase
MCAIQGEAAKQRENMSDLQQMIFDAPGFRARIGRGINARVVTDFGCAFGTLFKSGAVVVGRDGRDTGEHYARSLISGLNSVGHEVYALGMIPSATLAVAAKELGCAGAISITPGAYDAPWSGMKFFDKTGQALDGVTFGKLLTVYRSGKFRHVPYSQIGKFKMDYSCIGRHIQRITEIPAINLMNINRAQLHVVVDCSNASGAAIVPEFLRCIGVRVSEMNCNLGSAFPHSPNISSRSASALSKRVRKDKADLGILVDADASHVALVDNKGKLLSIESAQMMCLRQIIKSEVKTAKSIMVEKGKLASLRKLAQSLDVKTQDWPESGRLKKSPVGILSKNRSVAAFNSQGGLLYPNGNVTRDALVIISLTLSDLTSSRLALEEHIAALKK